MPATKKALVLLWTLCQHISLKIHMDYICMMVDLFMTIMIIIVVIVHGIVFILI